MLLALAEGGRHLVRVHRAFGQTDQDGERQRVASTAPGHLRSHLHTLFRVSYTEGGRSLAGTVVVELVNLFLAGLLAGEEFVVRFGVRGPLAGLDDASHIEVRQALIMKLRLLVPAMYLSTLATAIVVLVLDATSTGVVLRWAGLLALVVWILVTMFGTVPINAAALEWDPQAPPSGWKASVDRWERFNTVRAGAAAIAFALFLTALAARLQ